MINVILDNSNRGLRSDNVIDEVELFVSDSKLELHSNGPIKGLEIVIKSSEDNMKIKDYLDMDIAYNQVGDLHHYLIYSLEGKSIPNGEITLLKTQHPFKVVNFIASNANHKSVHVKYDYDDSILPKTLILKKNYPNPFNPVTNIDIENQVADHVRLIIYDISGRYIASLVDRFLNVGSYTYQWDGKDSYGQSVASGMYISALTNSTSTQTQKMLLLK